MDTNKLASVIKKATTNKSVLLEIVQVLFQSRDIIHLAHLKTKSYAAHNALGEYYNSVLDFIDSLVETNQGCTDKLMDITISSSSYQEPIAHLKSIKEMLITKRDSLEYEFQKNIIDEITALVSKTLYKLQFLS